MLDFDLMELHDGRLRRVEVEMDGRCVVEFAHLSVFYRSKPEPLEEYEVWSCRVVLEFVGWSWMRFDGERREVVEVTDGHFNPSPLYARQSGNAGHLRNFTGIELELIPSPGVLVIRAESGRLVSVDKIEKLEDWVGPLS